MLGCSECAFRPVTSNDASDTAESTIERRTITVLIAHSGVLVARSHVALDDRGRRYGDFWINVGSIGVLALLSPDCLDVGRRNSALERRYVDSGLRWGGDRRSRSSPPLSCSSPLRAATVGFFDDDRADISAGELWLKVLVVIPIGTSCSRSWHFEECCSGFLQRLTSTAIGRRRRRRTVRPVARTDGVEHRIRFVDPARIARSCGTVVATTVAGLVFCFLRICGRVASSLRCWPTSLPTPSPSPSPGRCPDHDQVVRTEGREVRSVA